MSRFIYLVVLKCTGRTCNAHPVIGGDVVASSLYVYIYIYIYLYFFQCICSICILSYIVLFILFFHFLLKCMNITRKVFFFRFVFASWHFVYLARDGEGCGEPFWDHFIWFIYLFSCKKHENHQTSVFGWFFCLVAVFVT